MSLLLVLIPSNEDIADKPLQRFFHRALVNRFRFSRLGNPGELIYDLDNPQALELLIELECRVYL